LSLQSPFWSSEVDWSLSPPNYGDDLYSLESYQS
jgi:hypothetical protein